MAVTIAGFWESYFSTFGEGPWQFHAHGIAASIWIILVATQSWTAHRKQFVWHAAAGKASLLLFPFLIGGLAAIIDLTAKGYVAGDGADPGAARRFLPAWAAAGDRGLCPALLSRPQVSPEGVAALGLYAGDPAHPVGIAI